MTHDWTENFRQAVAEAEALIADPPFEVTEQERAEGYDYLAGSIRSAIQAAFSYDLVHPVLMNGTHQYSRQGLDNPDAIYFNAYLDEGDVDRSANPTPGNKKGGLSNIVEKAMGSIAKSGTSPIVEVLSPAERPTKHGMIYAATPASDIVCGPCQLASGIGLQVFMTGRGTPYGLAAAPVIKVCSRNEMKEQWPDLIDVNAGPIATGEKTIAQVGEEMFNLILDVASGVKKPFAEQYKIHNFLCIFNPAPIT